MKKIWNEQTKNSTGLPRPIAKFGDKFKEKNNKFYLYSETPIPFQTAATPEDDFPINLIKENEEKVYFNNVCPFCGLGFEDDEIVIRWTKDEDRLKEQMPKKVPSDHFPFHLECMKQTRVYCPHMRERLDEEFITGSFKELNFQANNLFKNLKEIYYEKPRILQAENNSTL